ncbi:MAG: terminase family protein [Reyranella sp.]|uniref:terminase large subunit domain-containing protein n=1 Tax=Reyranella sp. TaxID=1929291 RepID=UPI003D0C6201
MTDDLDALLSTLEGLDEAKKFNRLKLYKPYPRQKEFHALGRTKRERMLRAGNQVGKTLSAAAEVAMHLTGNYPTWWRGRRWDRPVRFWGAGESSVLVRDTMQKLLVGPPGVDPEFGSGFIPRDAFVERPSLSRGVTNAYDTMLVRHKSGGVSQFVFKSYEQGRTKFQGDTVDGIWLDEEPPMDIYTEALTRTTATGGMVMTTFTPLKGKTELLVRFMDAPSPDRQEVVMTIYDAEHLNDDERRKIIDGWPEHEREARAMGVPIMGEGRVFPFGEDMLSEEALPMDVIPKEWTRLWGLDFGTGGGGGHPFAAVLTLWDREADCIHVHAAVRSREPLYVAHVAMLKPIAEQVLCAWPHDGNTKEKNQSDETATTAKAYKKAGLRMMPSHATFPDGGISTEAGINEMYQRMKTGRFKVAKHLLAGDWGNEFRSYHRKDGLIVKVNDDLMSATRQAVMTIRSGDLAPLGPSIGKGFVGRRQEIATGIDFDLWT